MEEKKYSLIHILIAIIITIILSYLLFGNKEISEIDYKNDEYVQELEQKLEEKNETIESLRQQYNEIQSSIDNLREDLIPNNEENYLIVTDD